MSRDFSRPVCSADIKPWVTGPFFCPINPKVACLVAELNIRGIATTCSGDTGGVIGEVLYVDLAHDDAVTLTSAEHDLAVVGWTVGMTNIQFLGSLVDMDIPKAPSEFIYTKTRVARKGSSLMPFEARAVAAIIAAHRSRGQL